MKKENTYKRLTESPDFKKGEIHYDPNHYCKEWPDHWSPYKFTTHDGVDIYVGDTYWLIQGQIYSKTCYPEWEHLNDHLDLKRFSSKAKAQQHLDEQNKPKFEVGKVYKRPGANAIYMLVEIKTGTNKYMSYGFDMDGVWSRLSGRSFETHGFIEATPTEWESALKKEAERRYPRGTKYKGMFKFQKGRTQTIDDSFFYINNVDEYITDGCGDSVYLNGQWASKIEEPKTTSEYIREYEKSNLNLSNFVSKYNLIITKAPNNA